MVRSWIVDFQTSRYCLQIEQLNLFADFDATAGLKQTRLVQEPHGDAIQDSKQAYKEICELLHDLPDSGISGSQGDQDPSCF